MKKGIIISITLEMMLFSVLGLRPLLCLIFSIVYSLLMYKEFFIPGIIRPHLTTYAIVHTIVTIPMGISIFSAYVDKFPWELDRRYLYFSICNWFVFNIFEFGRKTFSSTEERGAVESYSKIFSKYGAVFLVFFMAIISMVMLFLIQGSFSWAQGGICITLLIIGVVFSQTDNNRWAKIYRGFSSGYIVLFYIIYIIEVWLEANFSFHL